MLSNHQKWYIVAPKLNKIDKIFFGYDAEKIKNTKPEYFTAQVKNAKAGNVNIDNQMKGLKDIILVFENLLRKHGTIDKYYNEQIKKYGHPYPLVEKLADPNNEYKLKNMGPALVCEYFKNIGIDIGKPDTHIKRIFGRSILGFSQNVETTDTEAVGYIKNIAEKKILLKRKLIFYYGFIVRMDTAKYVPRKIPNAISAS